ncbi:hypothetical protein [Streptomyces sp. NPDC058240]
MFDAEEDDNQLMAFIVEADANVHADYGPGLMSRPLSCGGIY